MLTVMSIDHPFRGHVLRQYGVPSLPSLVVAFVLFSFIGVYLYMRLPVLPRIREIIHSITGLLSKENPQEVY